MTDAVSMTKMMPISGSTRIWPVISAVTASVAPERQRPGIADEDLRRVDVEPQEPEQGADDQRAQQRQVRLGRGVEQRDEHVGDEGDGDRPARQPVEAVGDVDAVGRGDDREGGEHDIDPRVDRDGADERHRDGGDVIGLLDLPGRDDGDDRQPDQLLAGTDPLPGPGVEVVVEGAERADPGQRRERGEGRRVGALAEEEVDADDDRRR